MIRDIVKDESILTQKSELFVRGEDDYIIQDLLDTANAHIENCAGLASIQLGIPKRVIVARSNENKFTVFINPIIIRTSPEMYTTSEGCLSLEGLRTVQRHKSVLVSWTTPDYKHKVHMFNGRLAQILQHEIDHCNGKLI